MNEGDAPDKPRGRGTVAERFKGEGMYRDEGAAALLEDIRMRQHAATAKPSPEAETIPEAAGTEWGGPRKKRLKAVRNDLLKTADHSVLFTASDGETLVCEHDKRGLLRVNAGGTILVVVFGMMQVIVKGRRLNILRDAFEVHRVDDVRPASRPEFDVTSPHLEHIAAVSIGMVEPFRFDAKGEYQAIKQE